MSQGERHTLVEVCRLIDRDTGPVFTLYQVDTKTCLDRQSFSSIVSLEALVNLAHLLLDSGMKRPQKHRGSM